MVSALRKWWHGDFDAKLAEAQSRVDAAPEGTCVPVEPKFVFHIRQPAPVLDDQPQHITIDTDIRLIKRALCFGSSDLERGRVRTIETGPTCEKCGQSGLAYRVKDKTEIMVCSHVERGLREMLYQQELNRTYESILWALRPMPDTLTVAGVPVKSIECGRHLKMTLRMRYCWFD